MYTSKTTRLVRGVYLLACEEARHVQTVRVFSQVIMFLFIFTLL
jgi:hypothetical protein